MATDDDARRSAGWDDRLLARMQDAGAAGEDPADRDAEQTQPRLRPAPPPAESPTRIRPRPPAPAPGPPAGPPPARPTGRPTDRPTGPPPSGPPPGRPGPPPSGLPVPAPPPDVPGRGPAATPSVPFTARTDARQHPRHDDLSGTRAAGPLARAARSVVSLVASDDTPRRLAEAAEVVRSPLNLPRRVLVLGAVGGAGTSTVTTLLARSVAQLRPDPVLVVASHQDFGSLATRVGVPHAVSPRYVLDRLEERPGVGRDALPQLLADAGDDLFAIPECAGSAAEVADVTNRLGRLCAVLFVDGGARLTMLDLAEFHAVVLVVPASLRGVAMGHRVADVITTRTGRPGRLHVVLDQATGYGALSLRREATAFRDEGYVAHALRDDRHLAQGAQVRLDRVAEPTRLAATELAAAVVAQALGRPWQAPDEPPRRPSRRERRERREDDR